MDQVQATNPSIQEINAALLARHKAMQGPKSSTGESNSATAPQPDSFASTLQQVEKQELAAPTPLKATVATPKALTPEMEEADSPEECAEPAISRSARMACAEKATQVNYEDDDFSVGDLVDLLNPLQHIPLIGTAYRSLTDDTIKPDVQVAGSLLFGLATGSVLLSAASGIASAAYEANTGKEPTIHVAESLFGEDFLGAPDPLTEEKITVADASEAVDRAVTPTITQTEKEPSAPVVPDSATTVAPPLRTKMAAATQVSAPGLLSSTGSTRVGSTIYTSPMMGAAGKVATTRVTQSATATASTQMAATASAEPATKAADATLGALIQEQSKAHEAGHTLPPDLIHDMMIKALDKYKMAHSTTSDTASMAVQ